MVNPINEVGASSARRGSRPATVVTAVLLAGAAAVLLVALVALAWFARAYQDGLADEAARLVVAQPGELAAEHSTNLTMAIVVSVMGGLPALWLAATLWPMLRGSNVARILAAIAAFGIPGLGLLMALGSCLTGLLFVGLFAGAPFDEQDPGGFDQDPGGFGDVPQDPVDFPADSPFQEKLWQLQGSGPTPADALPLIVLVVMGLLTAVAVLLVVSPTNRWYSPQPAMRPGRPYPVYYPVYVPVPQYPAQQPGTTPAPPFAAPPAVDHGEEA
jgi:hypothetical protein